MLHGQYGFSWLANMVSILDERRRTVSTDFRANVIKTHFESPQKIKIKPLKCNMKPFKTMFLKKKV